MADQLKKNVRKMHFWAYISGHLLSPTYFVTMVMIPNPNDDHMTSSHIQALWTLTPSIYQQISYVHTILKQLYIHWWIYLVMAHAINSVHSITKGRQPRTCSHYLSDQGQITHHHNMPEDSSYRITGYCIQKMPEDSSYIIIGFCIQKMQTCQVSSFWTRDSSLFQ